MSLHALLGIPAFRTTRNRAPGFRPKSPHALSGIAAFRTSASSWASRSAWISLHALSGITAFRTEGYEKRNWIHMSPCPVGHHRNSHDVVVADYNHSLVSPCPVGHCCIAIAQSPNGPIIRPVGHPRVSRQVPAGRGGFKPGIFMPFRASPRFSRSMHPKQCGLSLESPCPVGHPRVSHDPALRGTVQIVMSP